MSELMNYKMNFERNRVEKLAKSTNNFNDVKATKPYISSLLNSDYDC